MQINFVLEQQRRAAGLEKKKENELKNLQGNNMLKQNEMQLNIKKENKKAEKEKDYTLVKMVSDKIIDFYLKSHVIFVML